MDDNDIDMCPEIHKPAIYFAITGRPLWRESPLSHATYRQRQRAQRIQNREQLQFTAYDIRQTEIAVSDVVWFLIDFALYCCELLILLLSVLMATLTSIILYILVFGQY